MPKAMDCNVFGDLCFVDIFMKNILYSFGSHVCASIVSAVKKPFFRTICLPVISKNTHRVAISNKRIVSIENGNIAFKWRDYKDDSKNKLMNLSADEFIRRFLIHILPSRFMKIRHYGLLGNRNKITKLKICKQLTNTPVLIKEKASTLQLIHKITGIDLSKCLNCGSDKPKRFMGFGKAPPTTIKITCI